MRDSGVELAWQDGPVLGGRPVTQIPRLIVIRGNSASVKSAAAAAIRDRHGRRDLAIVSQDNLRRVILREHDVPGGANIDLIDQTARFALSRGYHTIVEGIFNADHYGAMLTARISDHPGSAFAYFLDVLFSETLRRHTMKEGVLNYGEAEMRQWYRGLDLLPGGIEQVIPAESSLEDTVSKVMADAGLKLTCPLRANAASAALARSCQVAGVAIRNVGTMNGSMADGESGCGGPR